MKKFKNPFDLKFETRKVMTVSEELSNQELIVVLPTNEVLFYKTENGYPYENRKLKEYTSIEEFEKDTNMEIIWFELIETTRTDMFAVSEIYDNFPDESKVYIVEF